MDSHRLQRIESSVIRVLSEMLSRQLVRDPRVNRLVTISYAKISRDLGHGEVGVAGYMSKTALRKSAEGLNSAAGFAQRYLGKHIRIRSIPQLHFMVDTSLEKGFEILQKINNPAAPPPHNSGGSDTAE